MAARVVVVYEEAASGCTWAEALAQSGVDVTLTTIGSETMAFWAEMLPDLIVLEDFDCEAVELALYKRLRRVTPVPTLLLRARADEEFHVRAYRAGVDECIAPPLNPKLVVAKMTSWLRRTPPKPAVLLNVAEAGVFRLSQIFQELHVTNRTEAALAAIERGSFRRKRAPATDCRPGGRLVARSTGPAIAASTDSPIAGTR